MGQGVGQQSAWGWAGSLLGQSRGLARGAEKQGEPCGEGFRSQAEGSGLETEVVRPREGSPVVLQEAVVP